MINSPKGPPEISLSGEGAWNDSGEDIIADVLEAKRFLEESAGYLPVCKEHLPAAVGEHTICKVCGADLTKETGNDNHKAK